MTQSAPPNPTSPVASARPVVRLLTRSLRGYPALTRLYTVVPLALLCYAIGSAAGAGASHVLAAAAAVACALAGGFAYNDLRDQAEDRVNRPGRPLVGGLVTRRDVETLVTILFTAAVLLAVTTWSLPTIAFIILLIASALAYSHHIKRVTGLKNAFVGLWSGFLPWGAALEHAAPATMLTAALIVALFVTQKELAADVYDREGDAAGGVTTIPVAFGPRAAVVLLAALNTASFRLAWRTDPIPFLAQLLWAGEVVFLINALSLCFVFLRTTPSTVRAYLELQKMVQIGGCIGLFAVLVR